MMMMMLCTTVPRFPRTNLLTPLQLPKTTLAQTNMKTIISSITAAQANSTTSTSIPLRFLLDQLCQESIILNMENCSQHCQSKPSQHEFFVSPTIECICPKAPCLITLPCATHTFWTGFEKQLLMDSADERTLAFILPNPLRSPFQQ